MADCALVQKDEIRVVRMQWTRILRKRERQITLLSDCFAAYRTPK